MTPAGESNKGDTSGACLMIFSFRLFQLGYLAVISAVCVSLHFFCFCSSLPLPESISLSFYLSASLPLSVGLFGLVAVEVSHCSKHTNKPEGILNDINTLFSLLMHLPQ